MSRAALALLAAACGLGAGFAAGFTLALAGWASPMFAAALALAVLAAGFSILVAYRLDRRVAKRLGAIGEAVGHGRMQRGREADYVEAIVSVLFQKLQGANGVRTGVLHSPLPLALVTENGEIVAASAGLAELDPQMKRGLPFPDFARLAEGEGGAVTVAGKAYRAAIAPADGTRRMVSLVPEGTVLTDETLGAIGEAMVSGTADAGLVQRLAGLGPALTPLLRGFEAMRTGLHLVDGVLAGEPKAFVAARGRNDSLGARAGVLADVLTAYAAGREEEDEIRTRLEHKLARIGEIVDRHRALAARLRDAADEARADGAALGTAFADGADGAAGVAAQGAKARQAVGEAVAAARLNNESAAGLGTLTQEISDLVAAIENVSFRTNLIALNASVEAARAGEKGAGFAVVADEVRTLAQSASNTAKDIRKLVARGRTQSEDGIAGARQLEKLVAVLDEHLLNLSNETGKITNALSRGKGALAQLDRKVATIAEDAERATGGAHPRKISRA